MRSCRRVRSCRRAKRGKRISVASYNLRLDQKRASSSESSSSSNIPRKGVEEAVLPSMKVDAHGRNRNGSSRERVFLPESSSDLDILRKGVEKAPLPSAKPDDHDGSRNNGCPMESSYNKKKKATR